MSPSRYGNDNVECRCSATEVFPHPAGPVMTQMCLCGEGEGCGGAEVVASPDRASSMEDMLAGSGEDSDGGVGGSCC